MIDGVKSGKYLLGELIEPKKFTKMILDQSNNIIEEEYVIYGRKIPLNTIRRNVYHKHMKLGIMRENISHVKRNFLIWADHSTLMNGGYLLFTVRILYSKKIFLTDEEYFNKYKRVANVQSLVETPTLYILGNARDTLEEKLSYTETRLEDTKQMELPLNINGVKISDTMRIFLGIYTPLAINCRTAKITKHL